MTRITYKVHDVTIPEPNDPSKTISKDVFLAEDTHAETGMVGFPGPDAPIASGSVVITDTVSVIRGEGAAADILDFIRYGAAPDINDLDLVWIKQGAEPITIAHNTASPPANEGPILLLSQADKKMIGDRMVLLQRQGNTFQEIAYDGIVGNNGVLVEDDNGNAIIVCGSVASAVNYLKVTNSATTDDIVIEPVGTDTDIGLTLQGKGGKFVKILSLITTKLYDVNALVWANVTSIASAVNDFTFQNAATGTDPEIQASGTDSNVGIKLVPKGTGEIVGAMETMMIPLGDESTVNTTGVKYTFDVPNDMQIVSVYQSTTIAPTTSQLTLDILDETVSIFSTKPTIAATQNNGEDGVLNTNPHVLTKGDKLEFSVVTLDSGGTSAGSKLFVRFYRTS